MKCIICGSKDRRVQFAGRQSLNEPDVRAFRCTHPGYGSHPDVVVCERCGHMYQYPMWSREELVAMYAEVEDGEYLVEQPARVRTFRERLETIDRSWDGSKKKLLDIGAYVGVFIEQANTYGWQAEGLEPSEWGTAEAERKGLKMRQGVVEQVEYAASEFDVITMWDVIEHVHDPVLVLERCHTWLRDGGMIAVHTMDRESLAARVLGKRWPWLMDMHLHYFSLESLQALLEDIGFEIVLAKPERRYASMRYVAGRIGGMIPGVGKVMSWMVEKLGIGDWLVPINMGDLVTVYATKKSKVKSKK